MVAAFGQDKANSDFKQCSFVKLIFVKMIVKKQIQSNTAERGSVLGKPLGLLFVAGLVGGGVWGSKYLLSKEEEKVRQEKYWTAEKSDFLVTVKLTGRLAATDVVELKCQLEGSSTIESIVDEGFDATGPFRYTIQPGDTLASIAEDKTRDELSIRLLNSVEDIDWDNLPEGQSIMIPGDLLVELDPLNLKERINQMEIVVQKSENALLRMQGNLQTTELSAALALKVANNNHKLAVMALEKVVNSTIKNQIKSDRGSITNLANQVEQSKEQMAISAAKLKWYKELEEKQFLSKMKLREEELKLIKERNNAQNLRHQIALAEALMEAYLKYDKVSLLNQRELAVDEALVNIEKTKVANIADLRDANATIATQKNTLQLEYERLEDLKEQMAATKIYAPSDGTVVYFSESYKEYGPIMDGARVHRGRNLIKLPKSKSLKVELNVPQSKRSLLTRGMKAWVQVEDETLTGELSVLGTTVDTNRRGHTEKSYFKGEVYIDNNDFPDSVSEGMTVTVEIKVINLEGINQRIKVPNQCVTTRMISEDTTQTGCYVLNPTTKKHKWRPVTIEYSDENFIALEDWASVLDKDWASVLDIAITDKQKNEWRSARNKADAALDLIALDLIKQKEDSLAELWEKMKDESKETRLVAMKVETLAIDKLITEQRERAGKKVAKDFRIAVQGFLTKEQLAKFDQQTRNDFMVFFKGLEEGELVHLSPLTEAENLNLEEAVMNKGRVELGDPVSGKTLNSQGEKNEPVNFGLSDEQRKMWDAAQAKTKGEITEVLKKIQSREIPEENAVPALSKAFESSRAEVEKFLNEDQLGKYDVWIIPAKQVARTRVKRFLSPKSSLGQSAGGKQRRSRN